MEVVGFVQQDMWTGSPIQDTKLLSSTSSWRQRLFWQKQGSTDMQSKTMPRQAVVQIMNHKSVEIQFKSWFSHDVTAVTLVTSVFQEYISNTLRRSRVILQLFYIYSCILASSGLGIQTSFIMAVKFSILFFFNANKPYQPRCHGHNSTEYFNQSEAGRPNQHKYKGITKFVSFNNLRSFQERYIVSL